MTSTIPVEFRSSDGNPLLYIDETNERIGVGTNAPSRSLSVNSASSAAILGFNRAGTEMGYFGVDTTGVYLSTSAVNQIFRFYRNNGGTETARIDASGNFGIGTTAPVSKLHISTGVDTDSGVVEMVIGGSNGANARTGRIIKDTTTAYTMIIRSGDYAGTGLGSDLRFQTNNGDGDRITIKGGTGLVGIGTTAPSARLHVLSTTEILRLGYDTSNYGSFTVGSAGKLNISTTAEQVGINSSNAYTTLMVQKDAINSRVYYPLAIDASTQSKSVLGSGTGIIFGRSSGGNITGAIASYANGTTAGVGIWGTPSVTAGSNSVYSTSTPDFYVHSNGNVGAGTIAPLGRFDSRATSGAQAVFSYDASNYVPFTVSSSGDLTIAPTGGDIALTSNISVSGTSALTGNVTFRGNGELITTASAGFIVTSYNNTGTGGQNVFRSASGTEGSPGATASSQVLGAFSFRGHTGSAFSGSKAFISGQANETWTPTANGTRLAFSVTPDGSTTMTEVMRIQNDGSISIGTGSLVASAKLNLVSTTQGFLPPRMTTTQKNAIGSPATGLVVFDTTLAKLAVYTGAGWETVVSA